MKYLFKAKMLSSILLMASSCIQSSDKEKNVEKTGLLFPKGTIGYRIYHNPECSVDISASNLNNLEIKFLNNNEKRDNVYGKAYYSNNTLTKLGVCNNFDRKLTLSIYNRESKLIYESSSKAVDTLYFSYPYPSRIEYNNEGQQEIKVYLRTSYSIRGKKEIPYDTAVVRVFYFKAE